MPRASDYSAEVADTICEGLIDGQSLRSICLADDMPSAATVCRWLADNASFREQYASAREAQADTLADEILDIADDGTNDWMERKTADGEVVRLEYNGDAVQRSRLRVDARKWYASKLAPKKYGDKLDLSHGGQVGLKVEIVQFGDDPTTEPVEP